MVSLAGLTPIGSGAQARFYKLTKNWGFKQFYRRNEAAENLRLSTALHSKCLELGFAARMGRIIPKLHGYYCEVIHQTGYARVKQIKEIADKRSRFISQLGTYDVMSYVEGGFNNDNTSRNDCNCPSCTAYRNRENMSKDGRRVLEYFFGKMRADYRAMYDAVSPYVGDLHNENWGFLGKKIVVIDFGFGDVNGKYR